MEPEWLGMNPNSSEELSPMLREEVTRAVMAKDNDRNREPRGSHINKSDLRKETHSEDSLGDSYHKVLKGFEYRILIIQTNYSFANQSCFALRSVSHLFFLLLPSSSSSTTTTRIKYRFPLLVMFATFSASAPRVAPAFPRGGADHSRNKGKKTNICVSKARIKWWV